MGFAAEIVIPDSSREEAGRPAQCGPARTGGPWASSTWSSSSKTL